MLSKKEKIDYIYNLVKSNSDIALTQIIDKFSDGTSVANFWNYLIQKIKGKSESTEPLTEEEKYLFYVAAKIDELRGITISCDDKYKIDYIYDLVQKYPDISLTILKDKFLDGTSIAKFWNNLNQKIKAKSESTEPLTKEENYLFYMAAKIDEIRSKISPREKIDYIYNLVQTNPDIALTQIKDKFSDGTSVANFWNYLIQKIKAKSESTEPLTEEENYLFYVTAKIDELRSNNFKRALKK